MKALRTLIARNRSGSANALASVCSAHPYVVAAALRLGETLDQPILIEATSNQVNQFGGYTGMRPTDFITWVYSLCDQHGVSRDRVMFGGDHLGPQVWRGLPADAAMENARVSMREFVKAGFSKIHLDCSEGCKGEPAQVGDDISATRAADLAAVCEKAAGQPDDLSYCFGTEVPPPGGARADEKDSTSVAPTSPDAARHTIEAHRLAFARAGLQDAWSRMVCLVVQPGLEFAPDHILHFDLNAPDMLSPVLDLYKGIAFEAHSTDYQHPLVFPELARRHFAVLKVGPALTFAMRRALYALDSLAHWQGSGTPVLEKVMETLMLANSKPWQSHYQGDEATLKELRHFGYADRIRYYWALPEARSAVSQLMERLKNRKPSEGVLTQFFPLPVLERARTMNGLPWAESLILAEIQEALLPYILCQPDARH